MSRFFKQWKSIVVMAVLTIAVAAPGFVSEAKTINKKVVLDKTISYVGEEVYVSYAAGIKINNKSTSKYKKKIKTSKTDSDPMGFSYQTKACFKDRDAYDTYDDYSSARYDAKKYIAENDYTLRFLKAGTYTVSYVKYKKESLKMEFDSEKKVNGKWVDYYKLEDNDGKLSSELFEEKEINGETYYQGVSSKKIYGYIDGGYTEAAIRVGADKKQHVYCNPRNVIKTTYSCQYKVLKTSKIISSVQLGKTKLTKSDGRGAYSSSSSSQRAFLSGNSGKLTVKAADKNYSITSIVVLTYDKEGKPVYTKVSNKKKINYGLNKSKDSYSSKYSSSSYSKTSMYKNTTVYVFYKNKFTGAFSRVNSITKNKYGDYELSITYRKAGDTKDTTVTRSYISSYSDYAVPYTFYKK